MKGLIENAQIILKGKVKKLEIQDKETVMFVNIEKSTNVEENYEILL